MRNRPARVRCYGLSLMLLTVLVTATRASGDPADGLRAQLERISRAQASIHTMAAEFVQRRTVALFEEELVSRGRFRFKRPGRVRWDVDAPAPITMVITPEGIVTQEPGGPPTRATTLPVPTAEIIALVSGSIRAVTQHFDVSRIAGRDDVFELEPSSPRLAKMLRSVTLELAPADKHLHRVVLDEASGDRTEIVFRRVEINGPVPDAAFVLDATPATR